MVEEDKKNIWEFELNIWLWTACLRRYCVKDVKKNIFIKYFVGGLKRINLL